MPSTAPPAELPNRFIGKCGFLIAELEDQPRILKTSTAAMIGSAVTRRCVVAVRSFSTKSEPVAIGFIGLGNMGFSMAKNLVNAPASLRSKVLVFDMDKSKSKELAGLGAVEAKDIQSMAKECDVIITMLPASKHVQGVMSGPEGIIANAKPGSLLIDSSTIDPLVSRSLHEAATAAKLRMVDAPVSGGVTGAAAGTLTFMVGGTQENLEASKVSA
jgi:3-hydroxyisobutyrate dehydrogenase-like beta-hydroxyacid dehydrogenase